MQDKLYFQMLKHFSKPVNAMCYPPQIPIPIAIGTIGTIGSAEFAEYPLKNSLFY